jgi:hypothetical protein
MIGFTELSTRRPKPRPALLEMLVMLVVFLTTVIAVDLLTTVIADAEPSRFRSTRGRCISSQA